MIPLIPPPSRPRQCGPVVGGHIRLRYHSYLQMSGLPSFVFCILVRVEINSAICWSVRLLLAIKSFNSFNVAIKIPPTQSRSLRKDLLNQETGEVLDGSKLLTMIDDEKLIEFNDLMGYYQIVSSELDMPDLEMRKHRKRICVLSMALLMACLLSTAAFAAGDVASALKNAWEDAVSQIKTVVDNVVFPALDMSLAFAFFVKLSGAYFDYRQKGQFEWTGPHPFCLFDLYPDCAQVHLNYYWEPKTCTA